RSPLPGLLNTGTPLDELPNRSNWVGADRMSVPVPGPVITGASLDERPNRSNRVGADSCVRPRHPARDFTAAGEDRIHQASRNRGTPLTLTLSRGERG